MTSDGIEDDVCKGFPEHRRTRETYRGDDGIQWECLDCGAEGWESSDGIEYGAREERAILGAAYPEALPASDGTDNDFFEQDEPVDDVIAAFEQGEKHVTSDGTEDEVDQGCCVDKCDDSCGGYGRMLSADEERRLSAWEVELITEAEQGYDVDKLVPRRLSACCGTSVCGTGIVGMFALGGDLAQRAKDIARGRPSSDGPVCKCPSGVCACSDGTVSRISSL